eukprot:Em0063g10a
MFCFVLHVLTIDTTTPVINVQVRLVGGSSPLEGRVEVYYNNTWGTVCDDFWTVEDAQVICRQLGFSGTSVAFSNAYFGAGSSNQPIWLDNVNCLGTETNVGQCLSGGWGIHNCLHLEDAGVRCSGPQVIRLAGGPTIAEGSVELYYNGSIRPSLTDMKGMFPQRQGSSDGNCASTENLEAELESGNVDTGGSTTVTKSHSPSAIASDELSLAIEDMDIGHRATKRKRIQTLVLIQGLSNLTFVSHTLRCMCHALPSVSTMVSYKLPGYHAQRRHTSMLTFGPASSFNTERCGEDLVSLYHTYEEVFLDGEVEECPQLVRLAGGPTPAEGRVELYYNGSYGSICQVGWDLVDATVVCKSLGYAAALVAMGGAAYGPGTGQMMPRWYAVSWASMGPQLPFPTGAGSSNQPIRLYDINCLGPQLVSLAGGPTPAEGRVELYYNGSI